MKHAKRWSIIGFFIIIGLGVLLHFLYDWLPYSFIGIFSPVNESIWEHLKLLFWPFIIYSLFELKQVNAKVPNYLLAKSVGIYYGLLSIIVLYYTIKGAFGKPTMIVDLLIYLFAVYLTQRTSYRMMRSNHYNVPDAISYILIIVLLLFIPLFTFKTPHVPLFLNPETQSYGINNE